MEFSWRSPTHMRDGRRAPADDARRARRRRAAPGLRFRRGRRCLRPYALGRERADAVAADSGLRGARRPARPPLGAGAVRAARSAARSATSARMAPRSRAARRLPAGDHGRPRRPVPAAAWRRRSAYREALAGAASRLGTAASTPPAFSTTPRWRVASGGRATCLIQPYPDGVTSRRTSVMACLSQGRAVVTTAGRLTEPLWPASGAVALADVARFRRAWPRPSRCSPMRAPARSSARARRQLYLDTFSVDRVVTTLRAADEATCNANCYCRALGSPRRRCRAVPGRRCSRAARGWARRVLLVRDRGRGSRADS